MPGILEPVLEDAEEEATAEGAEFNLGLMESFWEVE